jgi:hypothetical protein
MGSKRELAKEDIILPRNGKREAPDDVLRQGVRRRRDAHGAVESRTRRTGARWLPTCLVILLHGWANLVPNELLICVKWRSLNKGENK